MIKEEQGPMGVIKTIVPTECPSCKGEFFVEFSTIPTEMTQIFTREDMNDAKTELLKKVANIEMEEEEKKEFIDWVTKEDTLFSPAEVPAIIKSITPTK
jgi:predicted RNase H-like HicB family nuclease